MTDAVLATPKTRTILSTISLNDTPEARIVVLRGADRSAGTVAVHTDSKSDKVAELSRNPHASLLVWIEDMQLQMRLRGQISMAVGRSVSDLWSRMPDRSRANYGVTPAPGTVIANADSYCRSPDPGRLAQLTLRISEMDVVHLSDDFHRRALFRRADDWQGTWLAP